MFGFFVMGFVDIVGITTSYVKNDFSHLTDTMVNLISLSCFLWFLVLSIPTGMSVSYTHLDGKEFSQDSYQLYIATREQDLGKTSDNSWQSDTIYSNTPHAIYQGPEKLKSRTRYYWQVIAWDKTKRHKITSPISSFETAQLNQSDWTGAWITDNHDKDYMPAPMLRKSFIAQDEIDVYKRQK